MLSLNILQFESAEPDPDHSKLFSFIGQLKEVVDSEKLCGGSPGDLNIRFTYQTISAEFGSLLLYR